jgi:hypothetical protein
MSDKDTNRPQTGIKGYGSPGEDRILESSSPAVPSPSRTSEDRITPADPYIESLGEKPGDANPALPEAVGVQTGDASTAELLRARESAEEERLRDSQAEIYADQSKLTPDEWAVTDRGRPNWPDDRVENPAEYMDSPRADSAYMAGSGGGIDATGVDNERIKANADALADRVGTEASKSESLSGLSSPGIDPEEDMYERREVGHPSPPSEMDTFAPGMTNLPPEDKDER